MSGQTFLPATPLDLPLLPLRDVVVFPHMVIPLFVGRPKSIKALESAMEAERRIMLVAQKAAAKDEPSVEDMFEVGCIAAILQHFSHQSKWNAAHFCKKKIRFIFFIIEILPKP